MKLIKPCDLHDCPCWCDLTGTANGWRDDHLCQRAKDRYDKGISAVKAAAHQQVATEGK